MMSSTTPSVKYSCSGSPLRFWKGKTVMEGLSGRGSSGATTGASPELPSTRPEPCERISFPTSTRRTSPTKRKPLRGMVRTSCCSSPLSPMALRTAFMWLVIVDSETILPPQMASSRSSFPTTLSRFSMRCTNRSKTCGPTATTCPLSVSSRRSGSSR
ncbi:hypothetical protein D9M70_541510 [compost metagenome]